MKSFYDHLRSSHEFGQEIDYNQKPVLRSSGIFPVIKNSSYNSRILFLGYWIIKRRINEVSFLVTLRSNNGQILTRDFFSIVEPKSYIISLDSLLEKTNLIDKSTFLGSIEIEVFSTQDMVFPYPALVLDYYNSEFNTCVHTLGRIYNDIEDLKENEKFNVPETGFDIYASNDLQAFFSFVNGSLPNTNTEINYEITNYQSEKLSGSFKLGLIQPYQTIFFKFQDYIPEITKFLSDKAGTITIKHNFVGFFPRFLVGNIQNSTRNLVFTHSYYDCTSCTKPSDYWNHKSILHYDSSVPIPLFTNDENYTELVIYPNLSPSEFVLTIKIYDDLGNLLLDIPDFLTVNTQDLRLIKINFSEILSKNNIDVKIASTAYIITTFKDHMIPTRIKFGLNVGNKTKNSKLPCNICFNSNIANPSIDQKPGSFRWCPIFSNGNTVIVLENFSPLKNYSKKATVTLTFYRKKDSETLVKKIMINTNGEFRFDTLNNKDVLLFLDNDVGWMTAVADIPYLQGYYFNFHASGTVAGDHLF